MKSQWDCFLENLGEWHGVFTQLSPQGEVLQETPSVLMLEEQTSDRPLVRLTLRRGDSELVREFTSMGGGGLMFFEHGAFCQGSMQYAPYADFGAEFGFIAGDRRLRLVELYNQGKQLTSLTLIREHRAGIQAPEQPVLMLESLLGEWHGQAVTLHLDGREPQPHSTTMTLHREGSDRLSQRITYGDTTLASTGTITDTCIQFDQGSQPIQVLFLPNGASATCPTQIQTGHPIFLEAGWLLQPNQRQRLIRSYNAQGEWVSLTWVTEHKVA